MSYASALPLDVVPCICNDPLNLASSVAVIVMCLSFLWNRTLKINYSDAYQQLLLVTCFVIAY